MLILRTLNKIPSLLIQLVHSHTLCTIRLKEFSEFRVAVEFRLKADSFAQKYRLPSPLCIYSIGHNIF